MSTARSFIPTDGAAERPFPPPGVPPGKVGRMTGHARELVDDMRTWVELRIKLTRLEIEERIDDKINQAIAFGIVAAFALLTFVFALMTLALGLGAWLGHPAWGFLVVTILLALITVYLFKKKPLALNRAKKVAQTDAEASVEADPKLPPPSKRLIEEVKAKEKAEEAAKGA